MTRTLNDKSVRELIRVSRDIGKLSAISELLVKKDFPEGALVPVAHEINQYVLALRETLHDFVDGLDLSLTDDESVDYDEKVIGDALQSSNEDEDAEDDVIVIDDDDVIDDADSVISSTGENDIDVYPEETDDDRDSESALTKDIIDEEAIAEDVVLEIGDDVDSESPLEEVNVEDVLDFDTLEKSIEEPNVNLLEENNSTEDSTKISRFRIDEESLQAELNGVGD